MADRRLQCLALAVAMTVAALLAFGSTALFAQSPDTLSVTGTLVNGTAGGSIPAGITVLLHRFGAGAGSIETYEQTTDADGAFRFDDVPAVAEGDSIALAVDYGETRYTEVLSQSDLSEPVALTVYEFTRDVGVVTTTEQSIIVAGIDSATRRMAAVQLFTLENRSDTTLVPDLSAPPMIGQFSFLRFSLPAAATDLDVSTNLVGGEVIPVGTGFAITAPVPPGRHQVSFTFTVPYEGNETRMAGQHPAGSGIAATADSHGVREHRGCGTDPWRWVLGRRGHVPRLECGKPCAGSRGQHHALRIAPAYLD